MSVINKIPNQAADYDNCEYIFHIFTLAFATKSYLFEKLKRHLMLTLIHTVINKKLVLFNPN